MAGAYHGTETTSTHKLSFVSDNTFNRHIYVLTIFWCIKNIYHQFDLKEQSFLFVKINLAQTKQLLSVVFFCQGVKYFKLFKKKIRFYLLDQYVQIQSIYLSLKCFINPSYCMWVISIVTSKFIKSFRIVGHLNKFRKFWTSIFSLIYNHLCLICILVLHGWSGYPWRSAGRQSGQLLWRDLYMFIIVEYEFLYL